VNQPLRILLVLESSDDAALVFSQLQEQGDNNFVYQQVETFTNLRGAFNESIWDIVIADYHSNQFDYRVVLQILREIKFSLPLIVFSSEIGAEAAVDAIKAGVKDIVTKTNVGRLKNSIYQALQEQELLQVERTPLQKSLPVNLLNNTYSKDFTENVGVALTKVEAEAMLTGQNQVLQLILQGTPLKEVLDTLAKIIEDLTVDMKCSFLLLNPDDNKLYCYAAPSLPEEYNKVMNGVSFNSCSCTQAAFHQETVIVEEISLDSAWDESRDVALSFGLRACWSVPILTMNGEALGIFAMYYDQPKIPSDYDREVIIKVTHLAGIAIERDRTESELRKTKARLEKLSANIPGVIYQFLLKEDNSYSFPFISSSCNKIYEIEQEEIQQNPSRLLEIVHESDRVSLSKSIGFSAKTLQPWKWEGRITTPTGKIKWIQGAAQPEPQPNGDILWDGMVMDITKSKQTQEALLRSQAQLRQQATELEEALYELKYTQMQLVQTEKMSSLGQLVAGIAHEINNPVNFIDNNLNFATKYIQDLLHLVSLYQLHYSNPAPEIQAESEAIELEFLQEDLPKILSSMKLGTNRICDLVYSLRNFSRVDQKVAQTVDIHEIIDSVILILQHRCKPNGDKPGIKIIKQYGELPLVNCYPGQLNQVFMNLIGNAIDAIEEANVSNIYSHLPNIPINLNSTESFRKHNHPTPAISVVIDPSTPYSLMNRLTPFEKQVTKNPKLIPSLQANSATPYIQIITQLLDNSQVIIRIIDNGPGISSEYQNKIFNAFFTTKPVGKGTGLGLSISYQIIVEKHCGQLRCISEPGKGTEFWIQIPVNQC
jgi:signal transduction histidine kinase/DNA-binding NarL/FixJ family response regulator